MDFQSTTQLCVVPYRLLFILLFYEYADDAAVYRFIYVNANSDNILIW